MATSNTGIDIRKSGNTLILSASLKDATGAVAATGTTTARIVEYQTDGTLRTYDFADNTFKTTTPVTDTISLTHRQASNNTVNTGIWTAAVATLTGFTVGGKYAAIVSNAAAFPPQQEREFQYGGVGGDSVVQTGDSYPKVNTGIPAFAPGISGGLATADAQTSLSTKVDAISNNTSTRLVVPRILEIPDTGTVVFKLNLLIMDENGNMEAPDSLPTIAVTNAAGVSRSANLGAVTPISTGYYSATYTLSAADGAEALTFIATVVEGGATRIVAEIANVVNEDITGTAALISTINGKLPATVASQSDVATVGTAVAGLHNLSTADLSNALANLPDDTAAAVVATDEVQTILAGTNGVYDFDPDTGILILKDKTGTTTWGALTLTKNGDGVYTHRASA